MKVLLIESDELRRNDVIQFLKKKNIEFETRQYLYSSLTYIFGNSKEISGIIMGLGLQSSELTDDYHSQNGMALINELHVRGINIPILINSTEDVGVLDEYPDVFGQRTKMKNYKMFEKFVTFLTKKEKQ